MENHLKFFMPVSLKELLLKKVAVLLCSNLDILRFFYRSLYSWLPTCEMKEWLKATEEKLKLGLPESLNKQLIDCIQDIGFEIRKWKKDNGHAWFSSELEIELPDISKLCWTSTGAIDYRKIAEQYVLCDGLGEWQRYEIACRNCMENHIPVLWYKHSKKQEKGFEIDWIVPRLECVWPYILEGKQSKLDYLWRESTRDLTSFNQWAFEESAEDQNQVAAEYFFQKLTPEEREVSLMKTARKVFDGNVLSYLLSLMKPEQQMEIVKARPIEVLLSFLDWPRRHLLPENAGLIWTFLQESDYGNLLERINMILRLGDKCFPKLFREFLKNAPLDFIKKSFVGHESDICPPACHLLCELVDYEDLESIGVMFRRADAASRLKLVFCEGIFSRFYYCILKEKWYGVEACLREAGLSEEDRGALKESFMRYLDQRVSGTYVERKFGRFFELLHETNASHDKERKVQRLKLQ